MCRILYLEDDPIMAQTVERVLKTDQEIVHVATFKEFQQALASGGEFDFVISDVHVPMFAGRAPRDQSFAVVGEVRRYLGSDTELAFLTSAPHVVEELVGPGVRVFDKLEMGVWRSGIRELITTHDCTTGEKRP